VSKVYGGGEKREEIGGRREMGKMKRGGRANEGWGRWRKGEVGRGGGKKPCSPGGTF